MARVSLGMVILATAFFGIWTWLNDSAQVATIGQRATVIADLVWGLAGVTGSLGVFLSKPWTVWPLAVWAVCGTVAGGLAPVTWGEAPVQIGLVSGLVTAALLSTLVWWSRKLTRETPTSSRS